MALPAGDNPEVDPVEELLAETLALPEEERARAIEQLCREHPSHARELTERLRALADLGINVTSRHTDFPERLGEFKLKRRLGRGGMGVVFLAEQESLGREVALKVIRPEQLYFPAARERFQREVETVARLQHPGIVPVYSVGEAGGVPFFVMQRVVGCSLGDVLHELKGRRPATLTARDLGAAVARCTAAHGGGDGIEPDGAMFGGTWVQACFRIARSVADTLSYAHQRGVLHRDVKPSNILITPDGRVMLVDFGLASVEGTSRVTRTGSQLGSLPYLSPEQIAGVAIDARADVYALGVTLYELLALDLPYSSDSSETLRRQILEANPRALREHNDAVPWDAETVCMTAMEADRERRYPSAADFTVDLANVLELRPIVARRPGTWLRTRRWVQRHPTLSVALALGFLSVFVLPTIAALRIKREMERTEIARGETERAYLELGHRYEQIQRLSDIKLARDLLAREQELWPAVSSVAPAMGAWLSAASSLQERLPAHRSTRDQWRATAAADESSDVLQASASAWQRQVLDELIADVEQLVALIPRVSERLAFAERVERDSLTGAEAEEQWSEASDGIAGSERYHGLALAPQLGLLPLEPDPTTGLWEFWHLESGARPERDPESGQWRITEETGLVFVLLPGGDFTMGSQPPTAEHPDGPHVDPNSSERAPERPLGTVTLSPFFLSKYEMTQGQWQRIAGANPSLLAKGQANIFATTFDLTHPVENVCWTDCDRLLRRLGLALPTEAQWEYACRGGSSTVFWFGDEPRELARHENIASAEIKRATGSAGEDWSDGFAAHAPVGRFAPNPFGLHDMLGNVSEWCADWFLHYDDQPAREGDGLRDAEDQIYKVIRGGNFVLRFSAARSAARQLDTTSYRSFACGVRPARVVTPKER